jgi:LPPG:FO 2-phospho-L-lactate transferase
MKVTALAGGVGGAKLLVGLQRITDDLTAIVNTGDDCRIYGVHVSPDVDIVTYWLAGIADIERGWGIRGDTFDVIEAMKGLGAEAWFNLGDRDFATCLIRTERLRIGDPLSAVTKDIKDSLGVRPSIIPMTDDEVATRIVTKDGATLEFQEYFVRERQEPEVAEVRFAGIADAKPAPGVIEAIRSADKVIVCPSNPVVSIDPILTLPGIRDELAEHDDVTAVTPIVRGAPIKGPADKLLAARGVEVSARGVAGLYADLADRFVVDQADEEQALDVEALGMEAVVLDTIMSDHDASERLARALL